jgi:hypothetical protein
LRDDAQWFAFVGRHREAIEALHHAMKWVGTTVTADSSARDTDVAVQVLRMLAAEELHCGDLAAYRHSCAAIIDRCRQKNCYGYDFLRVCLLRPDAISDFDQLVFLAQDSASQGRRSLRREANVGGALYRAGRLAEAIDKLTKVDQANRLALNVGRGTPELVRGDNARVAVFLAMACARLGRIEEAGDWLAKSRQWMDGEGAVFAPASNSTADSESPLPPAGHAPSIGSGAAGDEVAPIQHAAVGSRQSSLEIYDQMVLADIVFEVRLLLGEAESLVIAR